MNGISSSLCWGCHSLCILGVEISLQKCEDEDEYPGPTAGLTDPWCSAYGKLLDRDSKLTMEGVPSIRLCACQHLGQKCAGDSGCLAPSEERSYFQTVTRVRLFGQGFRVVSLRLTPYSHLGNRVVSEPQRNHGFRRMVDIVETDNGSAISCSHPSSWFT